MKRRDAVLGILAGVLACLSVGCERKPAGKEPLLCYVGGTMRPAMEELVKLYKEKTGQDVQLDFGDSGGLIIRIENEKKGDLYVCHDPFLMALQDKKLGDGLAVATLTPVIVVPKGNPKNIRGLADLGNEGVRLIVTDFEYSTLGHMLPVMFQRSGAEERIRKNIVTAVRQGGQAANNVAVGDFDAGIVWNAVAFLRQDKLDAIPIGPEHLPRPELDAITSATNKVYDIGCIKVTIAVLNCSQQQEAARAFMDFVASPTGAEVFGRLGFSPAPPPKETPTSKEAGK